MWLTLLPFLSCMQKQQKNAHVPKFGNWDNDGNVPYTLYFDNARKGKGGKPMNPNDPVENPEAFSSSVVAPSPNRSFDQGRPALPPASPPPAHHHERRPSDAPAPAPPLSPYHRNAGGEPPRRGPGGGRAGGYSVEQSAAPSPLHPYGQSRAEYSDGSGYGLVANSVDRSRARGASRGNETVSLSASAPVSIPWICTEVMSGVLPWWLLLRSMAADEGVGGAQVRRLGLQPGVGGRLHAHLQQGEGGEEHPGQGTGARQGQRRIWQRPHTARRGLRLLGEFHNTASCSRRHWFVHVHPRFLIR